MDTYMYQIIFIMYVLIYVLLCLLFNIELSRHFNLSQSATVSIHLWEH